MKTISKILTLFIFAISAFGIASCSEDKNSDSGYTGGEFFEITIDGRTKTKKLNITSVLTCGEFKYIDSYDVEGVEFMLTTYSDLKELSSSPIGEYRFCPSGEPQNLDFEVSLYNEDYDYTTCKSGTHTVTSIKRSGQDVIVEGKFSGILSDNRTISGKYRLASW